MCCVGQHEYLNPVMLKTLTEVEILRNTHMDFPAEMLSCFSGKSAEHELQSYF